MAVPPNQPLVSVVIASYNRAELVTRAVKSALGQTYRELEVIVSDDCSPDSTLEMLRALTDERLTVHAQSSNVGCATNWTSAVRLARGEFIVFLGDDDQLTPGFVAAHVAAFEALREAAVVFSPLEVQSLDGGGISSCVPPFPAGELAPPDSIVEGVLASRLFFGAGMFKRQLAAKIWEMAAADGMVADWGLLFRMAINHQALATACTGCAYLKTGHPGQLGQRYIEVTSLIADLYERLLPECLGTHWHKRLQRLSSLERITLARHFAAHEDMARCRGELWRATRTFIWHLAPWKQLIQAYFWPSRLMRTAKVQRGFPTN